jgi:hypothetical protein
MCYLHRDLNRGWVYFNLCQWCSLILQPMSVVLINITVVSVIVYYQKSLVLRFPKLSRGICRLLKFIICLVALFLCCSRGIPFITSWVSMLPLSTILIYDVEIVPTIWYFCFSVFHYTTWWYIKSIRKKPEYNEKQIMNFKCQGPKRAMGCHRYRCSYDTQFKTEARTTRNT